MTKKALLALMMAAVMLLSGCSLVLRDNEVDALQTILVVNGEHVSKQDFLSAYDYNLYMEEYYQQMMMSFGFAESVSVDSNAVLESTLNSYISSIVSSQKADELGFDEFTDAEKAELDAKAQEDFDAQLAQIKDSYFANSELEGDALNAEVLAYAESMGYSLEISKQSALSSKISERLESSVTDSVTITDADLQAALDTKINAEKDSYAANLGAFGSAANSGSTTYYTPAGYRTIRVIEISKPVAAEGETAPADTARPEIDALVARLTAGEAFEALTETVETSVVCADSTDLDSAIVTAAMALTDKNAVSDVIETANGYALVQYVDEVAEHSATLDEARDSIYDETLENAKAAAYQAALDQWVNESTIETYLDRLN